ncbi:MAG TPA: TrmH family RNA methyltransferase, partial [Gaiellaceae bacterium]|nr:TrmH family RNA methyltransferase [Gaiellaceae bacterium]
MKEVVRLRRGRARRAAGLLVVEGRREVARARAAGLAFRATFVAPELLDSPLPPNDATPPVEEVSARVLRHMAYRSDPEGIVAVVEAPTHRLPPSPTLVLVAVGVEKPGNLGAMARGADAAGADALLVADGTFDPWNPNAIRASTGAVFSLPIVASSLDELRA